MKLLLIDGHYYVYRSFFALPALNNSRGEPTNAVLGFAKTVRRMLKDLQPEMGAVFWDEGLPQKRVELQPAYKETRKEMPLPMVPQLHFIRNRLTGLMGFKNISLPNTEADDLMGCYAIAACRAGHEVILATNDKDLFQLVNDKVKVYTTAKADLASPKDTYALLGEAEVIAKWDVPPRLIGDVLAISGDSIDNIPGAGIGRKAAAALLNDFGGLDALLENLDKVKSARVREKLIAAREQTHSHPWNPNSEMRGMMLSRAAGLERAGVNLARIRPGKESFVYHAHELEEEWIYILSGQGTAEIDGQEHAVGPGDFIGFPTPSVAHHLRNTGSEELVYLMGGEHREVEVATFPRLGKRMVRRGAEIEVYDLDAAKPFGPLAD